MDKTTRFILFGGGAGGGKSWWIAEKRLVSALQYPGHKGFIGRKELKRLMQSTYLTWNKVCQFHKIPTTEWKLNGQYNFIEFRNGSRIDLLDVDFVPSDPLFERFGSLEYTDGDLEEGGEIHFAAFDVLKSRVGRHMNKEFGLLPKIGITCNPTKNFLYQLFYKPSKENRLPIEYAFIQSLYNDNPYTAEEYGKQLAQITDQATKERLMFGNWEYDADPATLIKYEAILDLFSNVAESGDKYLTADIARYGGDKIVVGCWNGFDLYKVEVRQNQSLDKTIELIRNVGLDESIPRSRQLVDEDGIGGGVVDGLPGIKGFVANSKSYGEDNYANLKTQCSYELANKINQRKLGISAPLLETYREQVIEELGWIKSKDADKDGKRKVIPKDEVKEHIGRSPDFSDMMMMRMYFEVSNEVLGPVSSYIPRLRELR